MLGRFHGPLTGTPVFVSAAREAGLVIPRPRLSFRLGHCPAFPRVWNGRRIGRRQGRLSRGMGKPIACLLLTRPRFGSRQLL